MKVLNLKSSKIFQKFTLKKIKKICLEYHIINENYEELKNLKRTLNEHYSFMEFKTSPKLGLLFAKKNE